MPAFWKRISKTLDEASDIFGEASKSAIDAAHSRLNAQSAELNKAVKSMTDSATGLFDTIGSDLREATRTWASSSVESSSKAHVDSPRLPKVVSFRTKHRRSERSEFTVGVFGEDGTLLLVAHIYARGSKEATITRADGKQDSAKLYSTGFSECELRHAGSLVRLSKESGRRRGKIGHIHRLIEPYGWSYETSIKDLGWFHGRAEIMHGDRTLLELDSHEYDQMGCDSEITVDYAVDSINDYWAVVLVGLSMSGIVDTSDPSDDYFCDD